MRQRHPILLILVAILLANLALGSCQGRQPSSPSNRLTSPTSPGFPSERVDASIQVITLTPDRTVRIPTKDTPPSPGFAIVPVGVVSSQKAYLHLYGVMDAYQAGGGPRLLESYADTGMFDDGDIAWLYDNALVLLSLLARGTIEDRARAGILADSLVYAQDHDPDFNDGRLRDAYHAASFVTPDGQVPAASAGSATGNMAWATLALAYAYETLRDPAYLQAARDLGQWIYDQTYDTRGAGGYTGGLAGSPPTQTLIQWKATEHNIDLYVAFMKLFETTSESKWLRRAMHAKNFVQAMWNPAGGHFWTGTVNDGETINPAPVPQDAQTWALLALGETGVYGEGISWAEKNLRLNLCPGCESCTGFRFSNQGSGCWWEGTAHMALAYQLKGEPGKAGEFLEALQKIQATAQNNNGLGTVSACPGQANTGYGWAYPNALHIGATAWYIFAELSVNPFWMNGVDQPIPYQGLSDRFLENLARDTWRYISSDWATDNHLPWSWRSEQMSGGDYANPTEIGLFLLSYLGAYELQKDWSPSWEQLEAEVGATLVQLEAWQSGTQSYQPHGQNAYNYSVFYQNYWINWNPPVVGDGSYNQQAPSIDNAFLAASLITLREFAESNGKPALAQKAHDILKDMDFRLWWHPDQKMFSWGAEQNPQGGGLANTYSNENRIINLVARALGQLSREEFKASLAALGQSQGIYDRQTPSLADDILVDRVNWDGSYFTYATPALFIQEMGTAYGRKTINRATEAQIAYAQDQGYPVWGISDAFDVEDGDYVERGAPPRGSGNALEDAEDGLITPHASALALITRHALQASSNLLALDNLYPDLYHPDYGFKDAVNIHNGKVSYRFSALGQGWLFLSLINYLGDGTLWRYFYQDQGVKQASAEMFSESYPIYFPGVRR